VPNADLDDNVLLKADGMPTYNLANVGGRPSDGQSRM
jgi:glutamyl/glutaminyl-tRNA synthetase